MKQAILSNWDTQEMIIMASSLPAVQAGIWQFKNEI